MLIRDYIATTTWGDLTTSERKAAGGRILCRKSAKGVRSRSPRQSRKPFPSSAIDRYYVYADFNDHYADLEFTQGRLKESGSTIQLLNLSDESRSAISPCPCLTRGEMIRR
jgi:hypothetical protein